MVIETDESKGTVHMVGKVCAIPYIDGKVNKADEKILLNRIHGCEIRGFQENTLDSTRVHMYKHCSEEEVCNGQKCFNIPEPGMTVQYKKPVQEVKLYLNSRFILQG